MDMPTRCLTDSEIETYRETGFVKVRDLLTGTEIDRFERAVRAEIDSGRCKDLSPPKSGRIAEYSVLMEDCLHQSDLNFIVDHPNMIGAIECLLGGPVLLKTFTVHIKRPGWKGTIGD